MIRSLKEKGGPTDEDTEGEKKKTNYTAADYGFGLSWSRVRPCAIQRYCLQRQVYLKLLSSCLVLILIV